MRNKNPAHKGKSDMMQLHRQYGYLLLLVGLLSMMMMAQLRAAGLEIKVTEQAEGVIAASGMAVAVHYQGRLEDGTVFDDSYKRGEPITFILGQGQVIKGWEQGIEGMAVGEKRTLTIPPELGYGEAGAGDVIPPNATLIFDVELVEASLPPTLANLTNDELLAAQKAGAIIIDIRREDEWAQTGIIEGAELVTGFQSSGAIHPEFLDKFRALVTDKDTQFVLYCRTGNRTNMLGNALVQQLGYKAAAHLEAEIVGWSEANKETIAYQ